MPNFLTSSTQSLAELFYGPRTKDFEFENKIKEYFSFLNFVSVLKKSLGNKLIHMNQISTSFDLEVSELKKVSFSDNHFQKVIDLIIDSFSSSKYLTEKRIIEFTNLTKTLDSLFVSDSIIKQKLNDNEKKRKNYDYYDEKLENLFKKLNQLKFEYTTSISVKNISLANSIVSLNERIAKNEEKYKLAVADYLADNLNIFKSINIFISSKEPEIILCLAKYCKIISDFSEDMKTSTSKFDLIPNLIKTSISNITAKGFDYNPENYLRAFPILKSSNKKETELNVDVSFEKFENKFSSKN